MISNLSISAYIRGNVISIIPESKNVNFDIVSELPPIIVSMEATNYEVGEKVLIAAEKCRENATDQATSINSILALFGEKTYSSLIKKSGYALIARQVGEEYFTIFPGKRSKGGYEFTDVSFQANFDEKESIGEILKKSLSFY